MEEDCNTVLGLGLSIGDQYVTKVQQRHKDKAAVCLDLSFTLCLKQEEKEGDDSEEEETGSVNGSSLKSGHDEDDQHEGRCTNDQIINFNNNKISRKKLRLTKDQSALLETSFKLHNTLNPVQKHALAEQLSLTPRQVEVWFQNRRARTKLKQTEVDCEFLKKCCKSLRDENTRLKKELQELKTLELGRPALLCLHLPMCASCEKLAPSGRGLQQQQ